MAKRDPEIEPTGEMPVEEEFTPVGERLRAAREEKGVSLDEVAAQTRIPQRHLVAIEAADWDSLPAPTYTIGFAKSYAGAVGLDRAEIGNQLREEMGGQRFATNATDVFEPADPRRTMPKGLVIGAIAAVIVLVVVMSWLNKRSLEQPQPAENAAVQTATTTAAAAPNTPSAPPSAPVAAQGPVVLTATAPAWIQVTDQGKTLFEGLLQPGQTYNVPPTATAPMLKAGKPEALKVTVGTATAPPVGPPGKVTTVSLAPAALMKGPAAAAPAAQAAPPAPQPARRTRTPAPAPPAAAPVTAVPTPANTTE
jgi:cytoskeletal protein RodZ